MAPFVAEHIAKLELQPAQNAELTVLNKDYGKMLETSGMALTGMVDDEPMICAGVIDLWAGRGMAWALMSKNAGPWLSSITKKTKRFLDNLPHRRLEMDVVSTFAEGHRWASLLGFQWESHKPAYYPDGAACDGYVRIR